MGIEQGQGLGDTRVSEKLELRDVAVALEEEVAELRWERSHRHPSTNTILVPSVNEETEMDLLPHNEEGRGTYKQTFSGGQAETCPCSKPHPILSSAFLASTQQNPSCALAVTPQSPAEGLPCPALHWGPKNHPKAAQHLEL